MAKLFGFFDYSKEGPGIRKDAPKKKAFFAFFGTFFRNFWKFITINVVYLLISLPVITRGMSNAGITNITRNIARDKHSFGLSDFFETIRKNIKQAVAVGIINTVITAIIGFAVYVYYNSYMHPETKGIFSLIGFGISLSMAMIFAIMNFYIYTLMITFNFNLKALYKNSFKFVFIKFWKNLLCLILIAAVYLLYGLIALVFPDLRVWILEILIFIITVPSFKFLLIQFFTFDSVKKHIIDPYYEEHPDDDIEKRRNLGLDVPGDDEYGDMSWE